MRSCARRLIGDLKAASPRNGEIQARTAIQVYGSHLETDHQLLSDPCEGVLGMMSGVRKVKRRTILLDANVLRDKNLSVFL